MSDADGTGAEPSQKQQSFVEVALGALHNAEAVRLFERNMLKDQVNQLEKENEEYKLKNSELKETLERQRADEADLYYYLHKKLDDNYDVIARLETQIKELDKEKEVKDSVYSKEINLQREQHKKELEGLSEKYQEANGTLEGLRSFISQKQELESKLRNLEENLDAERKKHAEHTSNIERNNVREKERLKTEMLVKIKETKQNLLSMTEDQLHTTTKRTIMENDQMLHELHYQSKETEKLMARNQYLEKKVSEMKSSIEVNKEIEQEYAKRTTMYQNLIHKMKEKLKQGQLEGSAQKQAKILNEQQKQIIDHANNDMVKILQHKTDTLEKSFKEVCDKLEATQQEVERVKAERERILEFQDETTNFLLSSMEDVKFRMHSNGTDQISAGGKPTWKAGQVIPARVDELTPSGRLDVLEMLFRQLNSYQTKVKSYCTKTSRSDQCTDESYINPSSRAIIEKQFGVSLPPLSPEKPLLSPLTPGKSPSKRKLVGDRKESNRSNNSKESESIRPRTKTKSNPETRSVAVQTSTAKEFLSPSKKTAALSSAPNGGGSAVQKPSPLKLKSCAGIGIRYSSPKKKDATKSGRSSVDLINWKAKNDKMFATVGQSLKASQSTLRVGEGDKL